MFMIMEQQLRSLFSKFEKHNPLIMKKILYILLLSPLFLISSCETTHTVRKTIINDSEYDFYIDYNNSYVDTLFYLTAGDYLIFSDFTKLGCHPDGLPTSPCSLHFSDTINVSVNSILPYDFVGDFRDEYSWDENLSGNRATIQGCSFTITNDHIMLEMQ